MQTQCGVHIYTFPSVTIITGIFFMIDCVVHNP